MKTLFISALLLVCAGCVSTNKDSYALVTSTQLEKKIQRNDLSREYAWDHWCYAGSDDQYDYVYEYIPGSIIPYDFRFYKTMKGEINVDVRYWFDPDYNDNVRIF